LFPLPTSLKVELNVKNRTETLEVRSLAPYFSLGAANREGTFTLDGLLAEGTLISRVSARHLVTELRQAHDSVRVAIPEIAAARAQFGIHRRRTENAMACGSRGSFLRSSHLQRVLAR